MQKTSSMSKFKLALLLTATLPLLVGFTALPDPTKPPGATSGASDSTDASVAKNQDQQGQPGLTAVFIYAKDKYAIIDGQRVKEGDHLGEYIVTNIRPYTVELTNLKNTQEVLQLARQVKQQTNEKGR